MHFTKSIILKTIPIEENRILLRVFSENGLSSQAVPYERIHKGDLGYMRGKNFELTHSPARRWFHDNQRLHAITTLIDSVESHDLFDLYDHFLENILEEEDWTVVYKALLEKLMRHNAA